MTHPDHQDEFPGGDVVPLHGRRGTPPPLFGRPVPGKDVAVPAPAAPAVSDDDVLEGEIVRYKRPVQARPVFAAWIVDPAEREQATRWAVQYYRHEAVFHGVRAPKYLARLVAYTPRGAFRVAGAWAGWAFDWEGRPLRAHAVQSGDASSYLSLTKVRNERVKTRLIISGGTAAAAVTAAGAAAVVWPVAPYALLAALVAVLGYIGRPIDRAIVDKAIITGTTAPKLTPSQVTRALGALGNAEINKALGKGGEGITFASDPCRDGPGWRVDVDLPFGVTVADIIAKRERLASGLRRNVGCVWPESDPDSHAGRLVLWVGDQPLRKMRMPAWPLSGGGPADIFKPLPFGVDQRGRPMNITLMFSNLLLGALMRMGKTFCLRVLLLAASLDPTVELRTFELKGTGDLSPLMKVSHHYASGINDEAIKACLDSLRDLAADLERRAETISGLPKEICPENKVTRRICDRRELGLHPVVIAVDEAQNLFSHPEYGDEAGKLAERIIRVGPAMGVMLLLATQRPDKTALPTQVSSLVGTRFCLRVMDQTANDMILGTSMYQGGIRATTFAKSDLGIGYLVGEADDPAIVRTYFIDNPGAHAITDRALELRQAAGTVTGVAAGDDAVIETTETLVDHAAAVFRPGETALWNETILVRLGETHPELYAEWSSVDLGNAFRAAGVERKQIPGGKDERGKPINRRGVELKVLLAAQKNRS